MTYTIENGYVYRANGDVKSLVGGKTYTDTIRIDDNTVADITYQFDLETGEYVERSCTERDEPIPQPEPTPEDRIVALESEAALMALELVDTQTRLNQSEAEAAVTLLELVDTQSRLQQSEADHAALLLELVDKGVI